MNFFDFQLAFNPKNHIFLKLHYKNKYLFRQPRMNNNKKMYKNKPGRKQNSKNTNDFQMILNLFKVSFVYSIKRFQ